MAFRFTEALTTGSGDASDKRVFVRERIDGPASLWGIAGPKKSVAELTLSRRLKAGRGGSGRSSNLGGGGIREATALILRRGAGEPISETDELEDDRVWDDGNATVLLGFDRTGLVLDARTWS